MKGWGEFGWKFIPRPEKVCRACKQPIKKIDDVFEYRQVWPSGKTDLLCNACRPQAASPR